MLPTIRTAPMECESDNIFLPCRRCAEEDPWRPDHQVHAVKHLFVSVLYAWQFQKQWIWHASLRKARPSLRQE